MVGLQIDRDQDAARPAAQRLHQLRLLAAGPNDDVRRHRRVHEEVPGARRPRPASIRSATTWRRSATRYLQVLGRRSRPTKSLDDDKLADYSARDTFKTVRRRRQVRARTASGRSARVLQVQFHDIKGNDVDQFKDPSTEVIITPAEYKSGNVIYPYEKAQATRRPNILPTTLDWAWLRRGRKTAPHQFWVDPKARARPAWVDHRAGRCHYWPSQKTRIHREDDMMPYA